jgi:hypothetical protein
MGLKLNDKLSREGLAMAGMIRRLLNPVSLFLNEALPQVWCKPLRYERHIDQKTIKLNRRLRFPRVDFLKKQYAYRYLIESEGLGRISAFEVAPNLRKSHGRSIPLWKRNTSIAFGTTINAGHSC